jgi:catechol 2,3-dioxygenase
MPDGTVMGHVHLHVSDLPAAEAFYAGELGLDVTVRSYPGALFLSRDGYHHHVGLNTWAGEGAPPPPPGSRGLEWFELRGSGDGMATDPSGNRVLLA